MDGGDNDCNGLVDDGTVAYDDDGDGYTELLGDCDDGNPNIGPGAAEICNSGVDDDCDATTDEFVDGDADGFTICDGDCDDGAAGAYPGAVELCGDFTDNDCDGQADNGCTGCDHNVPTDFATIQGAIDGAASGELICVQAGTYVEVIDFSGKDVEVVSTSGAPSTIIDGNGSGPVVTFDSGEGSGAILDGFTITGGMAYQGGGVRVFQSSPTLSRLVISANDAGNRGGGIYLEDADATLEEIVAEGCGATYGGGMTVIGSDGLTTWDVQLLNNTANQQGGGLEIENSLAALEGLHIEGNYTGAAGGGAYIYGGGQPTLSNIRILGNDGMALGGGLFVDGADADLVNVELTGNEAWYGSGGHFHNSHVSMVNVEVLGNISTGIGGGLYFDMGSSGDLSHLIIAGNESMQQGGGLYGYTGTTITMSDTVVTANSSGSGGGIYSNSATVTATSCDSWGNQPDDYAGMTDPTGLNGNLSVDPQFLDATPQDVADWDLHLASGSPLEDAGSAGSTDPDGGAADMGSHGGALAGEWDLDFDGYPEWWQPGSYDSINYPGYGWDCDDDDPGIHPGSGC